MVPTRPGNLVSPSLRVAKRLATGPPDAIRQFIRFQVWEKPILQKGFSHEHRNILGSMPPKG
ncbi:MAG: hypothetical protein Q4C70_11170 [Planctomycetia bacterium]|nr:hypothetical protein [Planctomycetia bacterium]